MNWPGGNLKDRPVWLAAFVILMLFVVWGSLVYEELTERRAREAILSVLGDLSPNASVTINGKARQQAPVLEALRGASTRGIASQLSIRAASGRNSRWQQDHRIGRCAGLGATRRILGVSTGG